MEIKKTNNTKTKIKTLDIKNEYQDINFQEMEDKKVLDISKDLLKTNSSIPTHIPKNPFEQLYLYFNGTDTYELYIYINNEWKKATLS